MIVMIDKMENKKSFDDHFFYTKKLIIIIMRGFLMQK